MGKIRKFWVLVICILTDASQQEIMGLAQSGFPEQVVKEYEGKNGKFCMNAKLEEIPEKVYEGILNFSDITLEDGKKLYGNPELWKESDFIKDAEALEYGEEKTYLISMPENHYISLETPKGMKEIPNTEKLTEEEAHQIAEEAIQILGLEAEVMGRFAQDTDPEGVYSYRFGGVIEGVTAASLSDVFSQGSVEITGDQYSYFYYSCNYEVVEKREVELLDFEKILKQVEMYAKAGYIQMPESGLEVSEISLEYFVEEQKGKLQFYPVWNFQVPSLIGTPVQLGKETDDLFYLHAETGSLVKSM